MDENKISHITLSDQNSWFQDRKSYKLVRIDYIKRSNHTISSESSTGIYKNHTITAESITSQ